MSVKLNILRQEGSNQPISWDIRKSPHILISAPTNSGKSYFIRYLLSVLKIHSIYSTCIILDYKQGTDYWQWRDKENVFLGDSVYDGFDKAYKIFEHRRNNPDKKYPPFFLIFEEYQSTVESISKKADKEAFLQKVGNLLRLSRQVNYHLICICQRIDASAFPAGGRENFSTKISIGRLSPQAKQMLFPDDEDINRNKGQGEVNIQFDGQPVIEARTYTIRDMDKAEQLITDLLSRGLPLSNEAVARSP
ncbi:helicase HerA domain-containing protein [Streptococcus hyovaginalis]